MRDRIKTLIDTYDREEIDQEDLINEIFSAFEEDFDPNEDYSGYIE